MRQDLVLTSDTQNIANNQNAFRFKSQTINNFLNPHPPRTTRSSSLPLKIITHQKNSISDKLIRSWNTTMPCNRLCMYTNFSVSDFCINLIGNDIPITSFKTIESKKNEEKTSKESLFSNISSDESSSGSNDNISNTVSIDTVSESDAGTVSESDIDNVFENVSESETESETQFKLDEEDNQEVKLDEKNESNINELTITTENDSKEVTDSSSGYSSIIESCENLKIQSDVSLDETYRNLENDSSGEDDLFKDFMPKKSCLKKLFIDSNEIESVNATSSPVNPSTPTSPTFSLSSSSSMNSTSICSPTSTSSSVGNIAKKRVSFADNNGKELFTVRTMSEPSNCPPKLTSKIVEYFLNREFNSSNSNLNRMNDYYSNYRNYDYGISALNYTNDMSSLSGSIAVYSLNFAQPAGDYLKFRNRLDENKVSLENVILNRFTINGTIKVKNINFHKQVFIRCTFNNWASYEDYYAQYVPSEYYTTPVGPGSPTSSSYFYGNNSNYQPNHKDYDTFRFHFDLPKTVDQKPSDNNSPCNTIKFCVCFRTDGQEEFWDNNYGINYEILQYVIDIEKLKPNKQNDQRQSNIYLGKAKSYYESTSFSKANYLLPNQSSGIYY